MGKKRNHIKVVFSWQCKINMLKLHRKQNWHDLCCGYIIRWIMWGKIMRLFTYIDTPEGGTFASHTVNKNLLPVYIDTRCNPVHTPCNNYIWSTCIKSKTTSNGSCILMRLVSLFHLYQEWVAAICAKKYWRLRLLESLTCTTSPTL